ncbi:hypothetical protein CDAR_263621 [Caerostris darwini]|uniref:Uncharacterized protein n=1 Tax=Caerostris darwini TaxID=1538125 RepID=A0AAV4RUY2_9ARAC|nr:hypothetical protein CDAR_263621 [Caerostris darwini]
MDEGERQRVIAKVGLVLLTWRFASPTERRGKQAMDKGEDRKKQEPYWGLGPSPNAKRVTLLYLTPLTVIRDPLFGSYSQTCFVEDTLPSRFDNFRQITFVENIWCGIRPK